MDRRRNRDPHEPSALARMIGRSDAIREIKDRIRQIARSPVPVLILGETGTGKELCAEAIYRLSGREPFVPVNCAAFPETLIDTELFGHVRGAFTGADRNRVGLIEQAHEGVLFLDELAEVSPAVQAKLLRTLESGEYRPVGGSQTKHADFRILAATSGDLERVILSGRLRSDLLHRLGAMKILLPALRDRLEDLPLLADEFLHRYRVRANGGPSLIRPEALSILAEHPWHGNLRELRNVVEAACTLAAQRDAVHAQDVVAVLAPSRRPLTLTGPVPTLAEVLERAEQRAVGEALRMAEGNRAAAAGLLGISEATLYRKLARGRSPPMSQDRESEVRSDSQG